MTIKALLFSILFVGYAAFSSWWIVTRVVRRAVLGIEGKGRRDPYVQARIAWVALGVTVMLGGLLYVMLSGILPAFSQSEIRAVLGAYAGSFVLLLCIFDAVYRWKWAHNKDKTGNRD